MNQHSAGTARSPLANLFLALAGLNCVFQIGWFWGTTHRNINYDAMAYVGIARRIAAGDIHGSLHGYWSPLISWVIAAFSAFSGNFTLVAHVVTVASFLLCLPLLYWLVLELWGNRDLAAIAVLWFTLARRVAAFAVFFIGADFLLTACILLYFIFLVRCLRFPENKNWYALGLAHAAAFLTKAFAMPWLTACTLLASLIMGRSNSRKIVLQASLGLFIPLLVWTSWGLALKTKYGVFTPGYQSKWNLLDQKTRDAAAHSEGSLVFLLDTSHSYDANMVVDNMFPGSPLWNAKIHFVQAASLIVRKEAHNLPYALREIAALLSPGGVLALVLAIYILWQHRREPEALFVWIVLAASMLLILGYCMLVFDGRYVLPLLPLLIAITVPLLLPGKVAAISFDRFPRLRLLCVALLIMTTLYLQGYWASPFRILRRDYQTSCYDAARKLASLPTCSRVVVVGKGPYPERGVGWEAGMYANYFAHCRMVAFREYLPTQAEEDKLETDLVILKPDAILLFGTPADANYSRVVKLLQQPQTGLAMEPIHDSEAGQVGSLLWPTTIRSADF
jgi:4-amino-4-deoxy-L-arabinose transferase-like glycosyltransferase